MRYLALASCLWFAATQQPVVDLRSARNEVSADAKAGAGAWLPATENLLPERNLTIMATFPGDSAIGPKATPDNVGAAGPEHVVDFTCANVVVHEKKTGDVLQRKTQVQFWKDLGFENVSPNDPRFMYDPLSARWIGT